MGRGPKPAKSREAKPPVSRKSPKNEDSKVRDLEKRLAESLEREKAAGEILRVISSSPTDVRPVLETVAESAARLCDSRDASIFRLDGDRLLLVAHYGPMPSAPTGEFSIPLVRGTVSGRSVLDGRTVQVADPQKEVNEFPESSESARRMGHRTILTVPLMREGVAIGAINLRRTEAQLFTERQVALLQTFAAQAVIAIENVRLFKELEARNSDLTTALDRQTATSDVLRIIAQSPTELRPVLDAIAMSARRLCAASDVVIERLEGDRFYNAAHAGVQMQGLVGLSLPLTRRFPGGRAILDRTPIILDDIQRVAESEYPDTLELLKLNTIHSVAEIPLLSEGTPLGSLAVLRAEIRPFTDSEVALLKTFADQAVIAIENVRLFKELQTSNRDLTTALDKQTATSEILSIISQSQTDVQPVFNAIVNSAVRLLRARSGTLSRIVGDQIELAAHTSTDDAGDAATRAAFPQPLSFGGVHAQTIRNRAPLNIADAQTDPRLPEATHTYAQARGYRSQGAVPMLRHDEAVGAIAVSRREPGGFTDDEIALLQTFAAQAVIAIENVRLFTELQEKNRALTEAHTQVTESLERQTATSEILRVISQSPTDVRPVFDAIVRSGAALCHAPDVIILMAVGDSLRIAASAGSVASSVRQSELFQGGGLPLTRGSVSGRAFIDRRTVHVRDVSAMPDTEFPEGRMLQRQYGGHGTTLAVPLLREDTSLGVITLLRDEVSPFTDRQVALLQTFADQAVIAIENVRLFKELAAANRELAAASQHKSEFLANMSHELRTPLNAIIGFSEVLSEKMFGELNEKQEEYSKDIHASGQHLLSLINDILDLSKIEAGRMELELSDFHLPTALDSALTLVRERAGRRNIALHLSVAQRLGQIQADERKVRQVVLNLLSNAIKFTPEGGRIEVAALPKDGFVEVSVSDTGVGIAPEDQERVFEEFRQVGTAEKKAEGTGLGLTLCRKFVELHGGRIWVKGQLGQGSVFTFTIPTIE